MLMSIKVGIKKGDLVFISAIDTKDPLYEYSKRTTSKYASQSEHKLTSLVGMVGELMAFSDNGSSKSGYTKAIVRFSMPEDFWMQRGKDDRVSWWDRAYKFDVENKAKLTQFDLMFSKGVKLEPLSYMPSGLRYAYLQSDESIIREFIYPITSLDDAKEKLKSL
jgi:hypothetical protein